MDVLAKLQRSLTGVRTPPVNMEQLASHNGMATTGVTVHMAMVATSVTFVCIYYLNKNVSLFK